MTELERLADEVRAEHRSRMTERGRKRVTWNTQEDGGGLQGEGGHTGRDIELRTVRDTHVDA